MTKRSKVEIPTDVATQVLFESDRTCCVCREKRKPIQLHHIDGNPAHSIAENLAVLCIECHHETQIRGGFDRKLDAAQVTLYKKNWVCNVAERRGTQTGDYKTELIGRTDALRALRYMQTKETSEENLYSFEAEYPLVDTGDTAADVETNVCISAFITYILQRFRADATSRKGEKDEMKRSAFMPSLAWDDLSISHIISLYTPDLLAIEFELSSYFAIAVHPNKNTRTLNFQLHPSLQLRLSDIFKPESDYLKLLSDYCIKDLYRQQPTRFYNSIDRVKQLQASGDEWVLLGAGPDRKNYERFVITSGGIRVFFDPYQVGSYAEGRYEVFVPKSTFDHILRDSMSALFW